MSTIEVEYLISPNILVGVDDTYQSTIEDTLRTQDDGSAFHTINAISANRIEIYVQDTKGNVAITLSQTESGHWWN